MLYLSQAIGRPVLDANGEPLGKVDDLIVAVGDRYPPVTGLVVATDRRRIFLPWSQVARFDAERGTTVARHHRHQPLRPAAERDRPARRPPRQADRRHRRAQGRARQRPPARRRRRQAPPGRGRCRGVRAAPPPRDRGCVPDPRSQPAPADPGALYRLGGRRPGRDEHRLDPAARTACRLDRAPPGRPGDDHRPAGATRPSRGACGAGRRSRRRRHRGDGARDPGRGARGPCPRAGGGHPRGDVARRCRRSRRRPVRHHARRSCSG